MPMYIIGIAGGTGSGKTTVARKIIESLPKGEVALIPQDSYYIDATDMTMEERRKINYDHPCAFDPSGERTESRTGYRTTDLFLFGM